MGFALNNYVWRVESDERTELKAKERKKEGNKEEEGETGNSCSSFVRSSARAR